MRGVTLVAASGLAREVMAALRASGLSDRIALVDDDDRLWGTRIGGASVVGGLEQAAASTDLLLICAGRGQVRRDLVARLSALGVEDDRYTTLVHPAVVLPGNCRVGPGSVLLDGVVLTTDVVVGAHVVAMPHVTLTHDDVVDDYATLCAGVSLAGGVHIGQEAYLGMNSCVREHLTVGARGVLGMGSALLSSLPPGETWGGVPAQPLPARAREVVAP
jgi:sugar O-acyltransferase (sialic acid O-acetyltransferase NeuD family)